MRHAVLSDQPIDDSAAVGFRLSWLATGGVLTVRDAQFREELCRTHPHPHAM
jgi:hypothetical protein